MDKLTMDPFYAARKLAAKENDKSMVAKEMLHTTFWANLIAFLADYSLHQVILCYVYYTYIRKRRQRNEDEKEGTEGALFSSFLKKSTQLGLSRCIGLIFSSVGGSVGTLILPGWGTLLVSNMAEGAAGVIADDGLGTDGKQKKD
jgi:hypothetical protein